jgi:flotillin
VNTLYLVCFVLGLVLSLLAALSGLGDLHIGHFHFGHAHLHGHAHSSPQSHISALNGFTLPAFLCWFGGAGYLLHNYSPFITSVVLLLATLSGLFGAGILYLLLFKFLIPHERVLSPEDTRMEGVLAYVSGELSKMGLEVVSFTIREVRDKNEYITNMGRPDVARIKRDAEIAAAEAERDTAIRRANAMREAAIAKAAADQDRVIAETASLGKQAEAQRDLAIQKAQYTEQSRRQEAQADKAYELQTNVMQQQVIAEQVKVQQIEKEQQVKVQEAEILRHEKELISTILKGSEIEALRIQNIAAAEKNRLTIEAEGRAAATRVQGEAQAAITRVQGEAEANIIFVKGEAEAKAMNVKAEAYQEWSQAAVVDKLISNMADVVRAMAEPLSKVDKITIISTGGDQQTGASKITGDMTKIAAQVPAFCSKLCPA